MSKLEELEKEYGLEQAEIDKSKVISTGSMGLNLAVGNGGLVLGKIVEAFGDFSSGKSTATLHLMAEAQVKYPNRKVALFDYENSFDIDYATNIGVDVDNLIIYQPRTMEQGYDMINSIVREELVSLVVIDSHTAAVPQKILEGKTGDATMALGARMNSLFLSKIKGALNKHDVLLFAISQLRANIGGYGPLQITSGGNGWKFYSDVRLSFQKKVDKEKELNSTIITVVKNKCAVPFKSAEIDLIWGEGFDTIGEIVDLAADKGIITKGGSWLTYNDVKVQGKEKFRQLIIDNPELGEELKSKLNG